MTEEQIKEMLNGIINNGEKWECRPIIKANNAIDLEEKQNRYNFKYEPYKLGDEIHDDWEYRKVETLYVASTDRDEEGHIIFSIVSHQPLLDSNTYFKGTKEECEKWIEEHTKKTWLEEKYPLNDYCTYIDISLNESKRESVKEVCKKILEEVDDSVNNLGHRVAEVRDKLLDALLCVYHIGKILLSLLNLCFELVNIKLFK